VGRMMKWVMELTEYGIKYESRWPVKTRALVDFVVELTSSSGEHDAEDVPRRWILYVDGAFNLQGSGVEAILEGPNGVLIEQLLRFTFKVSNNQAGHEALIAGMHLATNMGSRGWW